MMMWNKGKPVGHGYGFNPSDYTVENDGLLAAFEEAYHDIAVIEGIEARANSRLVNMYSRAYHENGGPEIAQESVSKFMKTPVMEGFLGDIKKKLISLLEKLKEKIKAFFHSAMQYFDAFFKSEAKFVEKYKEEVTGKTLTNFKYDLYDWNIDVDFGKTWKDIMNKAIDLAEKGGVAIAYEALRFFSNDWVAALEAKTTRRNRNSNPTPPPDPPPQGGGDSGDGGGGDSGDGGGGDSGSTNARPKAESITSTQKKNIMLEIYAFLVGNSNSKSTESFRKALRKKLQGNREEPKETKSPDMSKIIKALEDYKETLDNIEEAKDTLLSEFDDEIDLIKSKDIEDENNKTGASNRIKVFTIAKDAYMTYFDVYKDCIKARASQYKSCFSAALHYTEPED